jgi:hypothetical protein
MLGEAIKHVKSLPRDAAVRADAFEALATQIEKVSREELGKLIAGQARTAPSFSLAGKAKDW